MPQVRRHHDLGTTFKLGIVAPTVAPVCQCAGAGGFNSWCPADCPRQRALAAACPTELLAQAASPGATRAVQVTAK